MSRTTWWQRVRDWLAGRLIALGERVGGVYEECGYLLPDGSGYYCALPVDHAGPHAEPPAAAAPDRGTAS